MLSGRTFLITGATGRLGCETTARLEELGATVLPLVLNGYPSRPKRVEWKSKTDPIIISTDTDLKQLETPDYVINLHWKVNRTLQYTEQLLYEIEQNIHRLLFLWNSLDDKSLKRFINISSVKVFSHVNQNPISVETEPRPASPYGIAKLAAEKFFDAHFQGSNFPVTHLYLCSVASCGEHPSHLMSQLYSSAFEKHRISINKGHTAHIIYVEEAVDLIINAALIAEELRYIITPSGMKAEQIASQFQQICGLEINAEYIDIEPGVTDPVFVSDIEKLRADWTRCTSLEGMIKRILELHHHKPSGMQFEHNDTSNIAGG